MSAAVDICLFPFFELQEVATFGPCRVMALIGEGSTPGLDYMLVADAISRGDLEMEEVSVDGQVPQLRVYNRSDQPVLILEGDMFVGGKQNRLCNSTVMVAAHSKLEIPVSCVESRRWQYQSQSLALHLPVPRLMS